jgi:hypothetical protein
MQSTRTFLFCRDFPTDRRTGKIARDRSRQRPVDRKFAIVSALSG